MLTDYDPFAKQVIVIYLDMEGAVELKYDSSKVESCVKAVRVLSAEAVEKAKSGHPGMPLGCADVAFILWHYFLKFNNKDPKWLGRDIFVLSAGHASMLQYSLLHLYGFNLSIDDIKQFRQLGSKTPGHPEYGVTEGVETTTGPLGQGFANGVGFALARKLLESRTGNTGIFNNKIYAIVSDGDIMEGISSEAASIAGNLGLDNLIYIYDKNDVSIEGPTSLTMSDDTSAKFKSMGWNVIDIDGFDHTQIIGALNTAKKHKGSPTLVVATTVIGKGANKKQGKSSSHGEPLGDEELKCLRNNLNWCCDAFCIPKDVYDFTALKNKEMELEYKEWNKKYNELLKDKKFKDTIDSMFNLDLPDLLYSDLRSLATSKPEATRATSGRCIQVIAKHIPGFVGGSADLGPSNKTFINDSASIKKDDFNGKNIHYGIREHAMGGISNGLALHGGFVPYASTFLIFSDYMRNSIRLSSLMNQQVVYVFTHDSIYVGEDGPTHQPIEQLSSLRLIPGLRVLRPCGEAETIESWLMALERKDGPTVLALTRQNLNQISNINSVEVHKGIRRGAYVVAKEESSLKCVVVASGSEVPLALEVRAQMNAQAWMRIVSVPCMELFLEQDKAYKDSVVPMTVPRVSIEAGSTSLWKAVCGHDSLNIGIDDFGTSAPGELVAKHKGLDAESISVRIKKYLS